MKRNYCKRSTIRIRVKLLKVEGENWANFYEELVNILRINYLEKLLEFSDEIVKYVLSANSNS